MARLTTLKPRLAAKDLRRVKPVDYNPARISGHAHAVARRATYARDAGRCCLCGCVVDFYNSEMDHRIALQFGGDNELSNLWTLCRPCHARKTAKERATGQPDARAMAVEVVALPDQSPIVL